ncbi:MAG: hypothetical protein JW719_02125 [Pirellulales bacterium]|nr:hypothetical protein [Pirellulales bacterium]
MCPFKRFLACLVMAFGVIVSPAVAEQSMLAHLTSPVIFPGSETTAYRDPMVVYHDGVFHLYCTLSTFEPVEGKKVLVNAMAHSQSDDLKHWMPPAPVGFTPPDPALNYSSPGNVIRRDDQWIMCLQTYPTTPDRPHAGTADSRVWIMRNNDNLANPTKWSPMELLRVKGPGVSQEDMGRMIDPYLIEDKDAPGKWWCFFKAAGGGVSRSFSHDLKTWTHVGKYRSSTGENVCIVRDGDDYALFTSPANGVNTYRSSDLASDDWTLQRNIRLGQGQKGWDWANGRLTAGYVLDLRDEPSVGKFVMFFHGSRASKTIPETHGMASIGIAWSNDLARWSWPGMPGDDNHHGRAERKKARTRAGR